MKDSDTSLIRIDRFDRFGRFDMFDMFDRFERIGRFDRFGRFECLESFGGANWGRTGGQTDNASTRDATHLKIREALKLKLIGKLLKVGDAF